LNSETSVAARPACIGGGKVKGTDGCWRVASEPGPVDGDYTGAPGA